MEDDRVTARRREASVVRRYAAETRAQGAPPARRPGRRAAAPPLGGLRSPDGDTAMSGHSSSGSWSGGGVATQDIIDLDKFMRGGVRPARPEPRLRCEELVVDAGGVDRKPVVPATVPAVSAAPQHTAPSSSSGSRPQPHAKRFSHDSGLSDGSYARRKHRPHRRAAVNDSSTARQPRSPPPGSNNSLRAFRAVCERALLDQQAQIARVAQLCERLTERAPRRSERAASPDTSDVSSSSRSTRDLRRKDKHRTEECKTYKIIMNKLDELNRLFAARARSPSGVPPHSSHGPHARRAVSSGSVSVSDKLVATEPEPRPPDPPPPLRNNVPVQVNHNSVTMRSGTGTLTEHGQSHRGERGERGGHSHRAAGHSSRGAAGGCTRGSSRLSGLRAVANTCALDIAPHDALPSPARHHIATESVVQRRPSEAASISSGGDPCCGFDLNDPVHLYSQAKRLQALPARTRRARSVEAGDRSFEERLERLDERLAERLAQRELVSERDRRTTRRKVTYQERPPRDTSLCALCRGYWRALRHYLAAQIFCYPDTTCH